MALALAIRTWVLNAYHVPSASMEPSLHCARPGSGCLADTADRLLVSRLTFRFRDPHRGEVVVFQPTTSMRRLCGVPGAYVKRILGVPGDTVEERRGIIYVNGQRVRESYLEGHSRGSGTSEVFTVGEDRYFVAGDNRADSCDSRQTDTVPRENLVGPVIAVYWPFDRIGTR